MTILDIAELAGVSKSTVSRVITGHGYVSASSRAKVEAAIREHGYTPSAAARALSRRSTDTVGLVLPNATAPHFMRLLYGVSETLGELGMGLIVSITTGSFEKDIHALRLMKQHEVCGLLYIPADEYGISAEASGICDALGLFGCPKLLVDRELPGFSGDMLFTDNFRGARDAVRALIAAGHEKIGIVTGNLTHSTGRLRLEGYRSALTEAGLRPDEKYMIAGGMNDEICRGHTLAFFEKGDLPTAFFAAGRFEAEGFLKAAAEIGLRIPEDIAYIGFEDLEGLNMFEKKYSHMSRDSAAMGRQAVYMLMTRMDPSRIEAALGQDPGRGKDFVPRPGRGKDFVPRPGFEKVYVPMAACLYGSELKY